MPREVPSNECVIVHIINTLSYNTVSSELNLHHFITILLYLHHLFYCIFFMSFTSLLSLVLLQVLYGKVSVRCFDKLENNLTSGSSPPRFDPPLSACQATSLRRSVLRSVAEYSETSGPCLLTPVRDNLHQIDAVEGPAAFLDILGPPYNPDDGRDCHYYRVLKTAEEEEVEVKEGDTDGKRDEQEQKEEKNEQKEMWLLEVPQPDDFWCGGEPYPGPAVSF